MSSRRRPAAPRPAALLAASVLALALACCMSALGFDPEKETVATAAPKNPQRAAAVAEMRAEAEAGDHMPYPDAYQSEQTSRLALRGEPRTVQDVQAIDAELSLIAEKRKSASDPHEIAALDARARELRRLALAQEELRD